MIKPFRILACLFVAVGVGAGPDSAWAQDEGHSRFSDEPIPLADLPQRPPPLLELGEPFLGTGTLAQGFTLPTGAVWQPQFLAFGTIRTAAQGVSDGPRGRSLAEAAGRFDLFGNLYLTQTERILVGIRPLDDDGNFTRYTLASDPALPDSVSAFQEELNVGIRTLFFEGDLSSLFPKLASSGGELLNTYFSVGRQPLSFQDGLLINDASLDMIGLTRSNMKLFGLVNTRLTGTWGWSDVDRLNQGDSEAMLFGLFSETDTRKRTVELDGIFVTSDSSRGNGVYLGLGSTRRIGHYNNTWRLLGSYPVGNETPFNRAGLLLHNQFGWTPEHSHNWVYINAFGSLGKFRSAARSPAAGGPLGRTGVLFAAVGLGNYGAALGSHADNAVGGSLGYQWFFDHNRKQLLLEGGGRYTYDKEGALGGRDALALGARYQMAAGRRYVIEVGSFGAYTLSDISGMGTRLSGGARLELTVKL